MANDDGAFVEDAPEDAEELFFVFWEEGFNTSGQIIATSHDLTPNGGLVREI